MKLPEVNQFRTNVYRMEAVVVNKEQAYMRFTLVYAILEGELQVFSA